jgi:ABC-2 type transport system permease protein
MSVVDQPAISQPWLFQRLRWSVMRNAGSLVVGNSRARLVTIVVCGLLVAATVFAAGLEGFQFLKQTEIPFSGRIIGTLFDFLFLALGMLLIFSGGIILYSSLFTSAETAFLLSTPARADEVFAYKFQAAIAFSSWAFLMLGLPILIAYGLVFHVPLVYYALLPVFLIGFLLLPGSVGAIACFLIVNITPQRRKQVLGVTVIMLAVGLVAWLYYLLSEVKNPRAARDGLQWLDVQFAYARAAMMPSHWMTRGIQAAARGDLAGAVYPLALLWANGLMAYLAAAVTAAFLYRRGYNRLATGGNLRKRYGSAWLDRAADRLLAFLDPQTRLLIIKDFRTFRRDPAQWAQILIFAALLMLYFLNSPQFYRSEYGRAYTHVIGFTNLLATAMLMCAYMSRFIYPMLSLEGRKFWILGLLPLKRERLLWGKFAFSASGAALVGAALIGVSDLLLGLGAAAFAIHMLTVFILAIGLSGLSVGLGALMPNFRETDPSKIAVGFGGTMNLIGGCLYLLLVLGLMAGPYHLWTGLNPDGVPPHRVMWVVAGVVAGIAVGVAAAVLPLRAGARVLRTIEF